MDDPKEFQYLIQASKYPSLFNFITIHSENCPESGVIIVNGQILSKFKHIESKDSVHTFQMWESPDFLPCLYKSFMQINFKFSSSQMIPDGCYGGNPNPNFNPNSCSIFVKIYYKDENDQLFNFVPNEGPLMCFDLRDGVLGIVNH